MAKVAALSLLLASSGATAFQLPLALTRSPAQLKDGALRLEFHEWTLKHNKAYADEEEREHRFAVWKDNKDFVEEYNKQGKSHTVGMNSLADVTHEEFKTTYLGVAPGSNAMFRAGASGEETPFRYADTVPPNAVDWRTKGAVTPVKNQAQCGSCWAFSTTGSVEGINAIKTGKLVSASEQELVDCDTAHDMGCNGGLMDYAFTFIKDNGGLDTESDYPYHATAGTCDKTKEAKHVLTIDGYEDVPKMDETALLKAVTNQPVSVAIEADKRVFQLYTGGVFDDETCGTQLDHGVLAVGFGTDSSSSKDFWIVKNSWGASWGENGYIRMARGSKNAAGMCGIASQPSYPTRGSGPTPPGPAPAPGPGPGPGPVKCDSTHECQAGSTCCCSMEIAGYCLSWGCCPLPKATCCNDHKHCCPHDHPVCDVAAGTCGDSAGLDFVPIAEKYKATKTSPRVHF